MTYAQVVETSVTNNSSFQNYPHPDDHTIRTTGTPGFKPFTKKERMGKKASGRYYAISTKWLASDTFNHVTGVFRSPGSLIVTRKIEKGPVKKLSNNKTNM